VTRYRPDKPFCDHEPPQASVIQTERGYRVQCLRCGLIGPERENPSESWYALTRLRYQDDESESDDTA
jgi:hypothetical protein